MTVFNWPGLLGAEAARRLLADALLGAPAGSGVELTYAGGHEALTRFAHNTIHQNLSEVDGEVEARVALGARVGQASGNDLSPAGLRALVGQAGELARLLPENPEWPGLPEPRPLAECLAFDEAVARLSREPVSRAKPVGEVCRAARQQGLLASGALRVAYGETAVLNSLGLFAYAPSTQIEFTLVVEAPETPISGYAHATGWRLGQVDLARLGQRAIAQARVSARPRVVPPGEYPVVLEPYASLPLLEALSQGGMGALAVQEERSWMNGRFGQPAFSPALSICDDAFDPDGWPQAFDCEGVPKQRVPIVQAGVPHSPVYDRLTAAREPGRESTGHAQPYADEEWDGPMAENLVLAPGGDTLESLVAGVQRGLYITRFWYVNQTTAHDAGVTGTTRDGVWWIERGELAYPAANLRFDQALAPALRGVRGIGRELATLTGFYGGVHRVPALALDSFRFVGVGEAE